MDERWQGLFNGWLFEALGPEALVASLQRDNLRARLPHEEVKMQEDEHWRRTAYCSEHRLQEIARINDVRHELSVGVVASVDLACGDTKSLVTTERNLGEMRVKHARAL